MAERKVPPHMMKDLDLVFEGSVKRVWRPVEIDDRLWFEYSDDYSILDWRPMPDKIKNRGKALTVLSAFFFEQLASAETWARVPLSPAIAPFSSDWLDRRWNHLTFSHVLSEHGAPSHYQAVVAADGEPLSFEEAAASRTPVYLEVLPAEIVHPEPHSLLAQTVYYYGNRPLESARRVIPLAVWFHSALPLGSALHKKLSSEPEYARALGLDRVAPEGHLLDRPILQFSAALEPGQRILSVQEALLVSGLPPGQFDEMVELSYCLALGLRSLFAEKGIELWDGRLQFAQAAEGLVLIDGIEPDELRLLSQGVRLSKDLVEPLYMGTAWEKAIGEAKAKARTLGRPDWQDMCRSRWKMEPEPLPAQFKQVMDDLYASLANHVIGKQLFPEATPLADLVKAIRQLPYPDRSLES